MNLKQVISGEKSWAIEEWNVTRTPWPLPDGCVQTVVTSPPYYGLRCYGTEGQLGSESSWEDWVAGMVEVFREVRRVLRPDGTVWLNLGDSYATNAGKVGEAPGGGAQGAKWKANYRPSRGIDGVSPTSPNRIPQPGMKPKDLMGLPWRLALALQNDGWWLRSDIIWHKPNAKPESPRDRPSRSHEYVFMLTQRRRYFWDWLAVTRPVGPWADSDPRYGPGAPERDRTNEPWVSKSYPQKPHKGLGRMDFTEARLRTVWKIPTRPYTEAHFATFPPDLVLPCVLAGTSEQGSCPACGAPLERIVVPTEEYAKRLGKSEHDHFKDEEMGFHQSKRKGWSPLRQADYRTEGWKPSCDCQQLNLPKPCLVLDPFMGSGTTALVATRLGRRCVGFELNPGYVEMARKRIINDAPLFNMA